MMTDQELVLAIRDLLSGRDWNADTLQGIAGLLADNGYHVDDITDAPKRDDGTPAARHEPVWNWWRVYALIIVAVNAVGVVVWMASTPATTLAWAASAFAMAALIAATVISIW
jgi:hypothetical protein